MACIAYKLYIYDIWMCALGLFIITILYVHICSPLPKDTIPRERPPMRDATWFKSETKIRRIPDKSMPVPHG